MYRRNSPTILRKKADDPQSDNCSVPYTDLLHRLAKAELVGKRFCLQNAAIDDIADIARWCATLLYQTRDLVLLSFDEKGTLRDIRRAPFDPIMALDDASYIRELAEQVNDAAYRVAALAGNGRNEAAAAWYGKIAEQFHRYGGRDMLCFLCDGLDATLLE